MPAGSLGAGGPQTPDPVAAFSAGGQSSAG